jgi:hypothetical protein
LGLVRVRRRRRCWGIDSLGMRRGLPEEAMMRAMTKVQRDAGA